MAKATRKAPEKVCCNPACGKTIKAATQTCPHCKTIQPKKKAKVATSKDDKLQTAIGLLKLCGSFDETIKYLQQLKQTAELLQQVTAQPDAI